MAKQKIGRPKPNLKHRDLQKRLRELEFEIKQLKEKKIQLERRGLLKAHTKDKNKEPPSERMVREAIDGTVHNRTTQEHRETNRQT